MGKCLITDLNTNVPTYLQDQYEQAIQDSQEALVEAFVNGQNLQRLEATELEVDRIHCDQSGGTWNGSVCIAKVETIIRPNRGGDGSSVIMQTVARDTNNNAIGSTITPVTIRNSIAIDRTNVPSTIPTYQQKGFSSLSECLSDPRYSGRGASGCYGNVSNPNYVEPVFQANAYAYCNKPGASESEIAKCNKTLTNINNTPIIGRYIDSYANQNIAYNYIQMGYDSVSECVARETSYPRKQQCNGYQPTKEQTASSVALGSALTAGGAVVAATGGAATGVLTLPQAIALGMSGMSTYQLGTTTDTCITEGYTDNCQTQIGWTLLSYSAIGSSALQSAYQTSRLINSANTFINAVNVITDVADITQSCGGGEYASGFGCGAAIVGTVFDVGQSAVDLGIINALTRNLDPQQVPNNLALLDGPTSNIPPGIDPNMVVDGEIIPDRSLQIEQLTGTNPDLAISLDISPRPIIDTSVNPGIDSLNTVSPLISPETALKPIVIPVSANVEAIPPHLRPVYNTTMQSLDSTTTSLIEPPKTIAEQLLSRPPLSLFQDNNVAHFDPDQVNISLNEIVLREENWVSIGEGVWIVKSNEPEIAMTLTDMDNLQVPNRSILVNEDGTGGLIYLAPDSNGVIKPFVEPMKQDMQGNYFVEIDIPVPSRSPLTNLRNFFVDLFSDQPTKKPFIDPDIPEIKVNGDAEGVKSVIQGRFEQLFPSITTVTNSEESILDSIQFSPGSPFNNPINELVDSLPALIRPAVTNWVERTIWNNPIVNFFIGRPEDIDLNLRLNEIPSDDLIQRINSKGLDLSEESGLANIKEGFDARSYILRKTDITTVIRNADGEYQIDSYELMLQQIQDRMNNRGETPLEAINGFLIDAKQRAILTKNGDDVDLNDLEILFLDSKDISSRLICGTGSVNCLETPIIQQALLTDLGQGRSDTAVIIGFGGNSGDRGLPFRHGALVVGNEIVGFNLIPRPADVFQRYANIMQWGDFFVTKNSADKIKKGINIMLGNNNKVVADTPPSAGVLNGVINWWQELKQSDNKMIKFFINPSERGSIAIPLPARRALNTELTIQIGRDFQSDLFSNNVSRNHGTIRIDLESGKIVYKDTSSNGSSYRHSNADDFIPFRNEEIEIGPNTEIKIYDSPPMRIEAIDGKVTLINMDTNVPLVLKDTTTKQIQPNIITKYIKDDQGWFPGLRNDFDKTNSRSQAAISDIDKIAENIQIKATDKINQYVEYIGEPKFVFKSVKDANQTHGFQDKILKIKSIDDYDRIYAETIKELQRKGVNVIVYDNLYKFIDEVGGGDLDGTMGIMTPQMSGNTRVATVRIASPTLLKRLFELDKVNIADDAAKLITLQKLGHEGGHALDWINKVGNDDYWITELKQISFNYQFYTHIGAINEAKYYGNLLNEFSRRYGGPSLTINPPTNKLVNTALNTAEDMVKDISIKHPITEASIALKNQIISVTPDVPSSELLKRGANSCLENAELCIPILNTAGFDANIVILQNINDPTQFHAVVGLLDKSGKPIKLIEPSNGAVTTLKTYEGIGFTLYDDGTTLNRADVNGISDFLLKKKSQADTPVDPEQLAAENRIITQQQIDTYESLEKARIIRAQSFLDSRSAKRIEIQEGLEERRAIALAARNKGQSSLQTNKPKKSTALWTWFSGGKNKTSGQVIAGLAPVLGVIPAGILSLDQYLDLGLLDTVNYYLSGNTPETEQTSGLFQKVTKLPKTMCEIENGNYSAQDKTCVFKYEVKEIIDNTDIFMQNTYEAKTKIINDNRDTLELLGCGPSTTINVLRLFNENIDPNNVIDSFYWDENYLAGAESVLRTLEDNYGFEDAVSYGNKNSININNIEDLNTYTGILIYGGLTYSTKGSDPFAHITTIICEEGDCYSLDPKLGKMKCEPISDPKWLNCDNAKYEITTFPNLLPVKTD